MSVSMALAFHAKAFSSKALSFMPIGPEINTKILETFSALESQKHPTLKTPPLSKVGGVF